MNTKQLRQKILDLAIHGKLVPQDPNDEPASVLLERVRAEKERLVKSGKIKADKIKTTADKSHYGDLPLGWKWATLGELGFYKKGPFGSSITKAMFIPDSDTAIKVYEQKNAIYKDDSLGTYFISEDKFQELKGFEVFPDDIIVSCAGTIGETYVMPSTIRRGLINQALMRIMLYDKDMMDFYLLYFDFILKETAQSESKGTAIKNIPPFDVLKQFIMPIPPLCEQKRIVEAVYNFNLTIDEIESGKRDILSAVTAAKQKILSLAIRGKLVPQDPDDEPAPVMLERIRVERERLIKVGKIKRNKKDSTVCKVDELHYGELPQGWEYARLSDICLLITDGTHQTPTYSDNGYVFLSSKNVTSGKIDWDNVMYIPQELHDVLYNRLAPEVGDILLAKNGTTGYAAVVDKDCIFDIYVSLALIRVFKNEIHPEYLRHIISSGLVQSHFKSNLKGIGVPNLHLEHIRSAIIPICSLAEQKRIVAAIEAAFEQLDGIADNI